MAKADYLPQLDVLCHHFASGHVLHLYHAEGKGYYRANGIYPVFSRTNHSPKVITGLMHDVHKVGTATTFDVIRALAEWVAAGNVPEEFPLTMVYQCDQSFFAGYYSLGAAYRKKKGLKPYPKDVTEFQDLIGKIVRPGGGTPTALFHLLAHKHGLTDRVNLSLEVNGFDPTKINLTGVEEFDVKSYSRMMLDGTLDVYSKPIFGHGQFLGRDEKEGEGLQHVAFSTVDAGIPPVYGVGIIARKDFVRDHDDMLRAFLMAIDKAMPECIANPDYSVRVMNEMRGLGEEYDRIEGIKGAITAGKHPEITGYHYGFYESDDTRLHGHGFGYINDDMLARMIGMLDDAGMLSAPVNPRDLYTRI
ncbi:MAG: ABC transporter substrate-binding protein, partial [Minisyncoccia bacterium]